MDAPAKRGFPLAGKGRTAETQPKDLPRTTLKALGPYVQCNICGRLCSRRGHIKCAECKSFNSCVKCFSQGLEKPPEEAHNSSFVQLPENEDAKEHKNYHKYTPVGPNDFALFTKDWSAEQEILLIDGIAKYGLGNWQEISEMVSMTSVGYKSWEECQQHYYNIYLNSPTAPLPDMTSIIHGPNGEPVLVPPSTVVPPKEEPPSGRDAPEKNENPAAVTQTKPANKPQVVGYWPLRGDFDIEYDNDAELILADMEFRPEDTPEQIELKLKVIEIYNSKLDERIYRKKIIISRGLLDAKAMQQKERRCTGEEKELYNILRPFLRFQTVEEHDHTVRLLVRERKLRTRLFQLMIWKALGLEKIEDIAVRDQCNENHLEQKYEERMNRIDTYKDQMRQDDPCRRIERRLRNPQVDHELNNLNVNKIKISDFLEEKEVQFCEALQLPPVAYFLAKRVLLHEVACNPSYTIDDMCGELKIDGTKHGRIFDLLLTLAPRGLSDLPNQVADLSKATLDGNGYLSNSGVASQMSIFSTGQNFQRQAPNKISNYFLQREAACERTRKQHRPNSPMG
ncbi:ADA2-like protein, putative [Babesia bigemina]|uniref:ADA2-like protein, putative n=1 Tax=Babesia bigemina TaxID=5866 RepID=A0A061D3D3_BABBI|nr:ADA2-like protein, putative [Babesia bigemina]CDR94592.1 ADA2-like protein, putative [Babesia bigemina]|eukprot:XP_012766778.1 ADA2-like protein, putative [Babesia bigemina]